MIALLNLISAIERLRNGLALGRVYTAKTGTSAHFIDNRLHVQPGTPVLVCTRILLKHLRADDEERLNLVYCADCDVAYWIQPNVCAQALSFTCWNEQIAEVQRMVKLEHLKRHPAKVFIHDAIRH